MYKVERPASAKPGDPEAGADHARRAEPPPVLGVKIEDHPAGAQRAAATAKIGRPSLHDFDGHEEFGGALGIHQPEREAAGDSAEPSNLTRCIMGIEERDRKDRGDQSAGDHTNRIAELE
ncbi:hypothetical protein AB2M62_13600 [Sphingomonas sp. MMS12-HWE2-04]|uniref:hypothetical protein n=1 Tax=Sphingomonas sp. MMS12-HWE2-04 TaxID=3234199 RepID=UPI003850088B